MVGGLRPGDPQRIGPYLLVGRLGRGGMGDVFLGQSAGGRPVAVKVIRADLAADPEFRVRFAREVAAVRRVSGLFTALVVDADVDSPVPWLATAYVAGPSLAEAVAGDGPMAVRPALALAAGLAEGLSAIHAAGVVHCDLKPSNVLLSPDGPRVIDFGISRAAGTGSPAGAGWVTGSPGFMSPEQALGGEIGAPCDIFSLGAVLTFAATGRGPFGQGSRPELAYRLVYGLPDLRDLPAGQPAGRGLHGIGRGQYLAGGGPARGVRHGRLRAGRRAPELIRREAGAEGRGLANVDGGAARARGPGHASGRPSVQLARAGTEAGHHPRRRGDDQLAALQQLAAPQQHAFDRLPVCVPVPVSDRLAVLDGFAVSDGLRVAVAGRVSLTLAGPRDNQRRDLPGRLTGLL